MTLLKPLWQATLGKAYYRLFRRWFDAIVDRLNTMFEELRLTRAELRDQSVELGYQSAALRSHSAAITDSVGGLNARLEELTRRLAQLDERLNSSLAVRWEHEALARRIVALEDAIETAGRASAES